ncbi:MAG: DNA methyltransferase [Calditrichia bacterium]
MELNRIYNMDCFEGMEKLPDKSIDLILTSPPFKDEDVPYNYYEWFSDLLGELQRVSEIVLMFNSSTRLIRISKMFSPDRILIWNKKRTMQPFRYGPIFIWNGSEEKINKYIYTDCFSHLPCLKQVVPYENPVSLYYQILKMFKNANTVLDPFMGSGTTAIACKKLQREFIGFEIEPTYLEIANKRIANVPEKLEKFL